ncbi:hypothetical protein [Mesorhizobium sp. NPDC059025]|uniref:hypothetical protein n=1 Tax=unclassified Mesorhizobium TaxID=325217 RepID=UPI00367D53F4
MNNDEIAAKLDTLIKIQAHLAVAALGSQKEKILFLGKAGLLTRDIADILGTTANTVSVALSNARKDGSIKRAGLKSTKGEEDGKE